MVPSRQCTFTIHFVTIKSNGIDPVALDVRSSNGEVPTYTGLAKHLLEGLLVRRLVAKFVNERDGVLSIWRRRVLGLESVERHECDTPSLLFDHDIENFGGGGVIIDDDVEEALKALLGKLDGSMWGRHLFPAVNLTAMLNF